MQAFLGEDFTKHIPQGIIDNSQTETMLANF